MKLLYLLADSVTLETPTTAFLKAGILGACVVVLAGVVVYLYRDQKKEIADREKTISERDKEIARLHEQRATLQEQHAKTLNEQQNRYLQQLADLQLKYINALTEFQQNRVEDAQATAERLLRANEQAVSALTTVTQALDAQREAMTELKAAFKEVVDEIRRSSPPRRG